MMPYVMIAYLHFRRRLIRRANLVIQALTVLLFAYGLAFVWRTLYENEIVEPDGAPGSRPQRVSVSVLEEQINEKIAEVSQQGRIVNISTRSQSLEAVLTKFFPEQD